MAAFKKQAKQYPNFGKAAGMGAEKWWSVVGLTRLLQCMEGGSRADGRQIIRNTFTPIVKKDQEIPQELIQNLLRRFWCKTGYSLFPDVQSLLHTLRRHYKTNDGRIVVGVITNSDPRVPDVLSSLGLRVSPLRYGSAANNGKPTAAEHDVDFTVMSYDVGHEKPDRRIFEAAEEMLDVALKADKAAAGSSQRSEWRKVYVGDEYDKDVVGAVGAGWNAVLIDRDAAVQRDDVRWLDGEEAGNFEAMFASSKAVGFSSLSKLAAWLPRP